LKNIEHILKNLGTSQKTLRHPWCPNLVTALSITFMTMSIFSTFCAWYWSTLEKNALSVVPKKQQKAFVFKVVLLIFDPPPLGLEAVSKVWMCSANLTLSGRLYTLVRLKKKHIFLTKKTRKLLPSKW